jgi:ubiquinone/menaquinone biosynthesis C-methylase UbiE
MNNDEVYAAGLLKRALDPATQPPEIQAYLRAELDLLPQLVHDGMRVLDLGCGTGRHLILLQDRLQLGLGVDYERRYIAEAAERAGARQLHFVVADATAVPTTSEFDFAMCLTNTWGTMSDKAGVLSEMRRLAPRPHTRFLSVYSETSMTARRGWYLRLSHNVVEETDEYLLTDGGLRSEHFSEARIRSLIGECAIRPLSEIAYEVTF